MNKIKLLIFIPAILLISCNKNYKCSCTKVNKSYNYQNSTWSSVTTTSITTFHTTRSKAKEKCDGLDEDLNGGTTTVSCAIK
jgi:hypothetical protein